VNYFFANANVTGTIQFGLSLSPMNPLQSLEQIQIHKPPWI